MGHQVIKLQNPLKTLGFLQFYRFKTVKDRIIQPCQRNGSKIGFKTDSFRTEICAGKKCCDVIR